MKKFWDIHAAEGDPATGELLLYGPIGPDDGMGWLFDDVTPKQFKTDLDALGDIAALRVLINSPGGDVFAGQAIHSMLVRHKAKVTVFVDGLAASIASIVVMAGDTVIMPKNAMMMVHNPWTIGMGDAREFRKLADTLDQIRESMIAAYQNKTGMERTALMSLLNAETWMTAEDAVEMGFADQIEATKKVAASLVRPGIMAVNGLEFDISHYHNAPTELEHLRDAGVQALTKRDAERALRDAGMSREAAKSLIAQGWQPEGEPKEDETRDALIPTGALRVYQDFQKLRARINGVAV